MLERLKQYIVEVCCAYALVSVGGAIVNQLCGFQTNNVNVMIMFVLCLIGTFVLYLHRLFDKFSPLFMIIVQYVEKVYGNIACENKEILHVNSAHIEGVIDDAEGYMNSVESFLNKAGI